MNQLSVKLGFWSAVLCAALFVIFTICFVGILLTSPPFLWTTYRDYIDYVNQNNQSFAHLARLSMLLFGGETLHYFALALTIGILFGIYSSVLVAAPLVMWLGVSREQFIKPKKEKEEAVV